MAGLAGWTAFAVWAFAAPARRTPALLVADLAVAVVAIALSPYVKGEGFNATLPGFWVMGAVLSWAILWRWVGGLAAAVAVSVADLAIRDDVTQKVYGNIFLLVLGGAIVGFLSGLLQQMAAQRDRAERAAAAAHERQRLARVVHDGVLQVLALVQRRAPELGPDGRELGRLAGEQEVRLRGLVQQDSRETVAVLGDQDLVQLLAQLQSPQVHVALPGTPALLPAERAHEVVAAVESCLSNVRHHVGREAEAWVLLEEVDDGLGGLRPRRRAGHPRRAGSRSRPRRAGWACTSRSSGGCATSAVRRRCGPAPVRAPSGSWGCRDDHPLRPPLPRPRGRPRPSLPGPARRHGDAVDERVGTPRGPDRLVDHGGRRRARPRARAWSTPTPTCATCSRRPAGRSCTCSGGSTATSPRRSPA